MKIDELSKISYIGSINRVNKISQPKTEQARDRVELSEEAKALSKAKGKLTPERLKEIQDRIENDFYKKDEVVNVVAERILKSPHFLSGAQGKNLDTNI